jgi:hypothetical protein
MRKFFAFIRHYSFPLLIVAAILILAGVYELGRLSVYLAHPELAGAEQAAAVLARVGKLIQLPSGETPTMATINDAASAKKSQPFLANAANGDILIVYPNAQQAFVYRPTANKLIAVGPVNSGATSNIQQPADNAAKPEPITASSTENATTTKTKR